MNTAWEIDHRKARKKSATTITTDLLDIGFRGLSDTLNMVNDLVASGLKSGSKISNCNCGCECQGSLMDCCTCGKLSASVDIDVQARLGERRMVSFLIENNRSSPQEVELQVPILIDGCGERLQPGQNFRFDPPKFVIPPCHCQRVKLAIDLIPPFKECTAYYAEIRMTGHCMDEKICLGIYVQPDNYVDHFTLTDSCRPKKGEFVEFASCGPCHCECGDCSCECCVNTKSYYLCDPTGTAFERIPQ
ncbi:hypothetical protein WIW50_10260 [Flavobacteriaceae bacterium 3-367]